MRGAAQCQTTYHEDPISGRLSITMPVGSLQQSESRQRLWKFINTCMGIQNRSDDLTVYNNFYDNHNILFKKLISIFSLCSNWESFTGILSIPMLHIRVEKRSRNIDTANIYTGKVMLNMHNVIAVWCCILSMQLWTGYRPSSSECKSVFFSRQR